MKHQFSPEQQFLVTFALNTRTNNYKSHRLSKIMTDRLGLYDTINNNPEGLSDGQIAEALLESLLRIFSDETYRYTTVAILNWWAI